MISGQAPLKPGVSLVVPLVGKLGAPFVGTDIYASDCNLDAAAVHAGVIMVGERAYVKVTLAEGLASYEGSLRNGIASDRWGKTKMSLSFEKLPVTAVQNVLGEGAAGLGMPAGHLPPGVSGASTLGGEGGSDGPGLLHGSVGGLGVPEGSGLQGGSGAADLATGVGAFNGSGVPGDSGARVEVRY